jgi:hypothetical protein
MKLINLLPAVALSVSALYAQETAPAAPKASSVEGREKPKLILQQHLNEGWHAKAIDFKDQDQVLATVWEMLPEEVVVYPTENYFYWKMEVDGREIYGNIRLPSGRRENGVLSLGYAEFVEFPSSGGGDEAEITGAKYFTKGDGVEIKCPDNFTSVVTYKDKTVTFRFNQIPQTPPKQFTPGPDEVFIQRNADESGMQFFLMFNTKNNYFFWVLNEEVKLPEHFKKLSEEVVVGRRSGFVFWQQKDRKVLASIRKLSVMRNDYFDGPFDQLADNYADETKIREWIERGIPSIKGRIDKYGYYTDSETPSRVALSNYGNYYTFAEALQYIENAKKSSDPLYYISRAGYGIPNEKPATTASAAPVTEGKLELKPAETVPAPEKKNGN